MTLVPEDSFAADEAWWEDYRADTLTSDAVGSGYRQLVLADGGPAGSFWYEDDDGFLTSVRVLGDFDVVLDSQAFAGDLGGVPAADGTARILALAAVARDRRTGRKNEVHMGHGRAPGRDAGTGVIVEHKSTVDSVTTWNTIAHPNAGTCRLWLRLRRVGTVCSGYYSTDGVTWTLAASWDRPDLPAVLDVGVVLYAQAPTPDIAGRLYAFGNTPTPEATDMSNSTTLEVAYLEWLTAGEPMPDPPDQLYFAVSNTEIGEAWASADEPAGYVRPAITWGAVTQSGGRSVVASSLDVLLEATDDLGELLGAAIVDTPTGTPTFYRLQTSWTPRTIDAGGELLLPAGSIVLRQG